MKSIIRRAERAAYDMRRSGILAHEYRAQADEAAKVSIAERIRKSRAGESTHISTAATGLAEDYAKLVTEILLSLGDLPAQIR